MNLRRLNKVLNEYEYVADLAADVDALLYNIQSICFSKELEDDEKINQISILVNSILD